MILGGRTVEDDLVVVAVVKSVVRGSVITVGDRKERGYPQVHGPVNLFFRRNQQFLQMACNIHAVDHVGPVYGSCRG